MLYKTGGKCYNKMDVNWNRRRSFCVQMEKSPTGRWRNRKYAPQALCAAFTDTDTRRRAGCAGACAHARRLRRGQRCAAVLGHALFPGGRADRRKLRRRALREERARPHEPCQHHEDHDAAAGHRERHPAGAADRHSPGGCGHPRRQLPHPRVPRRDHELRRSAAGLHAGLRQRRRKRGGGAGVRLGEQLRRPDEPPCGGDRLHRHPLRQRPRLHRRKSLHHRLRPGPDHPRGHEKCDLPADREQLQGHDHRKRARSAEPGLQVRDHEAHVPVLLRGLHRRQDRHHQRRGRMLCRRGGEGRRDADLRGAEVGQDRAGGVPLDRHHPPV